MNKYKLQLQDSSTPFSAPIRYSETILEAEEFKLNANEYPITEENLNQAKSINPNYKIGDKHIAPSESISFLIDGVIFETYNIFADSYFKLFKETNGQWELIVKHKC